MRLILFLILSVLGASPAFAGCDLGRPGATTSILIPGTGRSVLLHRPASPDAPLPLVVLLHGSGGRGANILTDSGMASTADSRGFNIAAPDGGIPTGEGFAWNIPGVPTVTGKIPAAADPDDVAFIGRMIDVLAERGCIDRSRVYATGLSGGGRMTSWLGCVAADRFAAIAPDVGLRAGRPLVSDRSRPDPATCQPSHSLPVMSFDGDADSTNPPGGGGAAYWGYSLDAALSRWAALNSCSSEPVRTEDAHWTSTRFAGCRNGVDVVSYVAKGRGHEWLAVNDWMWAFFQRFSR